MGPKTPHSTVLSAEEEALAIAFRKHTLLPLFCGLRGSAFGCIGRVRWKAGLIVSKKLTIRPAIIGTGNLENPDGKPLGQGVSACIR